MKVELLDKATQQKVAAIIEKANRKDMPLRKDGWHFTWRKLHKTEGADFYKLCLLNDTSSVEGMLMLSLMHGEMLFMNNVEVAPHNLGSGGKHEHVAGCLIAYGCLKSFELGQDAYRGYLTFESKTKLIDLYREKYGASLAFGQRMYIGPKAGLELIEKYLNE